MISIEKIEWEREPDEKALEQAAKLKDFLQSEAAYKSLIEQGSVLSMINLARWYEFKPEIHGGPDLKQAEIWYQKAIDAGSAVVTLVAGRFYWSRKDYEKTREIFMLGMERGYTPSMYRLAELYVKGWGVEVDFERAKKIFKIAASRGHLWSKLAVGALTVNRARKNDAWTIFKGGVIGAIAGIQIRYQTWRYPYSERLKK